MVKFGVFDHTDRGPVPLAEFYEGRLKLTEEYDRAGFHADAFVIASTSAAQGTCRLYRPSKAERSARRRIV